MFLIGFAIILLCMTFIVIVLGGDVGNYIDIPTLLIIFGALVCVLTATQSFKVFYAGLRAAIFPKWAISEDTRGQAASLFRMLSKTVAMAAVIGVLIGLINALWNIIWQDAGGAMTFGISISVSLITPLYALFFTVAVFEPVVFILKKRLPKR